MEPVTAASESEIEAAPADPPADLGTTSTSGTALRGSASSSAAAAPPSLEGRIVGERYRVVRSIGGGGMGHVFEAEHIALGRRFALKVLKVTHWDAELLQRFEREARALARVHSPRVAQVSDYGVDEDIGPWFVMELVMGETLQERLDRSPLSLREALPLAVALCEAVADVHARGIVHRDLKPANIGLPSGPIRLKLLDFGLAAGIDDEMLTRITRSHQVLGSLPYIAPEQFAGARPGKSQDLWALGVVIYEMMTGRLPFEAPSTAALMHRILTAPPPALESFPAPLRDVLGQLLVKRPQDRLSSAKEAAELLGAIDAALLPLAPIHLDDSDDDDDHVGPAPLNAATQARDRSAFGESAREAAHVMSQAAVLAPTQSSATAARPDSADAMAATAPVPLQTQPSRMRGAALGALLVLAGLGALFYLLTRAGGGPDVQNEIVEADVSAAGSPPVGGGARGPQAQAPAVSSSAAPSHDVPTNAAPSNAAPSNAAPTNAAPSNETGTTAASDEGTTGHDEPSSMTSPVRGRRGHSRSRRPDSLSMQPTTDEEPSVSPSTMAELSPSWMGEIIGGGWGGEIIEAPQ